MLISDIPKAYFDRFTPRPKDGASSAVMRNNFLALASCDFEPLRAIANLVLETHNFFDDAAAAETYSGTGVTVTRDRTNQRDGFSCLSALVDITGNRQILRTTLTTALDLSDFGRIGVWNRCDKISSAIQFILRDSSGNESYWNLTTFGTVDTWAQSNLELSSPDSDNGTPADLSDIVSYGWKGLEANQTYKFNVLYCHMWSMKIYIQPSYVAGYFYPISNDISRVKFDGGLCPLITAPSVNPKLVLVSLSVDNVLTLTESAEIESPDYDDIPVTPIGHLPLYVVYVPTTATFIVEYHLKDEHSGEAYIFADLRPWLGSNVTKNIAINEQTEDYTLVFSDNGKIVDMNKGTAVTLTVPKNSVVAFPTGTIIAIRQLGAGQVTIAPVDGDVTIVYPEGLTTTGQYAMAAIVKVAENTWSATGSLEA